MLQQIRQRVIIQHRKEGGRRLIKHPFQAARRRNTAWLSSPVLALDDLIGFLAEADNVTQANLFRRHGQKEAPADASLGFQVTAAAEVVNDFDQKMARNTESPGYFVNRNPFRVPQSGLHEHPEGVIRI
jgi:hypothetical protein